MPKRISTKIIRGQNAIDGAGVHLRRVLGIRTIRDFDPFLMLDGFDSIDYHEYIKGFPWHPHRGIETVTYLISGEIEHGDSLGNNGVIKDLDCQWMTAGSGIIHQEMPVKSNRMLGCQLWVNLPQKDKMCNPAYNDIKQNDIPFIEEQNAVIRIISGKYKNTSGALKNHFVQVQYLDVMLNANSVWEYSETPDNQTLFLYLLDGTIATDEALQSFEEKACAILFKAQSDQENIFSNVIVKAGENGARFLLIAAKPLNEPVAWGGPIVMNTEDELNTAFEELDMGTFIKHK